MSGKNQWVVNNEDGWAVRGENNSRVTAVFRTQEEARLKAVGIAKNQQSEVIIQNREGKIRQKNSYGNDPFPPKG